MTCCAVRVPSHQTHGESPSDYAADYAADDVVESDAVCT